MHTSQKFFETLSTNHDNRAEIQQLFTKGSIDENTLPLLQHLLDTEEQRVQEDIKILEKNRELAREETDEALADMNMLQGAQEAEFHRMFVDLLKQQKDTTSVRDANAILRIKEKLLKRIP